MTSRTPLLFSFIILIFCYSCNQSASTAAIPDFGNEDVDTSKPVITTTFMSAAYPEIFEAAFATDTRVTYSRRAYSFYYYNIGKIKVESGKLIACDPIRIHDALPFTQIFPRGEFFVHLALAKTNKYERVAFSRIRFSNNPVVKWEFALLDGQRPISIKDTGIYCYGVDGGSGVFIDSISNSYFNKKGNLEWQNVFITKAKTTGHTGYIHNFEGHNLATFSTGYGDGCYATYIGFDNRGEVCQLLTDFGIVEWWRLEEKK